MERLMNNAAQNLPENLVEEARSAEGDAPGDGRQAENAADCARCSCLRHKHRDTDGREYKALMSRLNRIEGQVRGVKNMLEDDRYCIDILIQVSAIQSALNAFNRELLSQHIKSCVAADLRAGKNEIVDELVQALQKLMK